MRWYLHQVGNYRACGRRRLGTHPNFNHVDFSGSRTIYRENIDPPMLVRPMRINEHLWNYQLTKEKVSNRILGSRFLLLRAEYRLRPHGESP
jgi:hypothetical protein